MSKKVTIYSRRGCHLCAQAMATARDLQSEFNYQIEEIFIDGNDELIEAYGEQVPVIHINDEPHDFFQIDEERFRRALR